MDCEVKYVIGDFKRAMDFFASHVISISKELIYIAISSFLARDDFCHLLITFANSSDPDQDRQYVCANPDSNRLTLIIFLKYFLKRVIIEKRQQTTIKSLENYPACKELITTCASKAVLKAPITNTTARQHSL